MNLNIWIWDPQLTIFRGHYVLPYCIHIVYCNDIVYCTDMLWYTYNYTYTILYYSMACLQWHGDYKIPWISVSIWASICLSEKNWLCWLRFYVYHMYLWWLSNKFSFFKCILFWVCLGSDIVFPSSESFDLMNFITQRTLNEISKLVLVILTTKPTNACFNNVALLCIFLTWISSFVLDKTKWTERKFEVQNMRIYVVNQTCTSQTSDVFTLRSIE